MTKNILYFYFFLFVVSCSTTVHIQTNPEGSTVFISKGDTSIDLGKTPISMKESKIAKKMGSSLSSLKYFRMFTVNNGIKSESVLVPVGRWGRRSVTVILPVDPPKNGATPDKVLQHILNAQKFAESKQLLKSHNELDEALKLSPNFSYAMSMKGALYFANKEFNRSKEWYTKALQTDPGNTEALIMLKELK